MFVSICKNWLRKDHGRKIQNGGDDYWFCLRNRRREGENDWRERKGDGGKSRRRGSRDRIKSNCKPVGQASMAKKYRSLRGQRP